MGRPALYTTEIEDVLTGMIKGKKGQIRKVSPKEAADHLKCLWKDKTNKTPLPGEKRLAAAIHDITEKLKNYDSELDKTFTIGASVKYNIPAEIIPILLLEQQRGLRMNEGMQKAENTIRLKSPEYKMTDEDLKDLMQGNLLTIRQALWIAKIYLAEIEIAKKHHPDNPKKQQDSVCLLAKEYAYREQIAEINDRTPDTSDIDQILINGEDVLSEEIGGHLVIDYIFTDKMKKEWNIPSKFIKLSKDGTK